jgi:dTDP-4-dehydrorhamnose reductase
MKIACTGLRPGRVATELERQGAQFISADITDIDKLRYEVLRVNPDLIIHTAAMTDVDRCEVDPKQALKVNAEGVSNLVDFWEGKLLYISSDHIFRGSKWFDRGYLERHNPSPVNVYGITKLAGEKMALSGRSNSRIIRTSKLFSYDDLTDTIYDLQDGKSLEVTGLLTRSFLYVEHFVNGILDAAVKFNHLPEILNISGTSILSYSEFWKRICRVFEIDESLIQVRRKKLKDATPRPFRAGLNTSEAKKLGIPLYSALDGIKEIKELYYG